MAAADYSTGGFHHYTYDSADRLIAVSSGQEIESSYGYNGLGDRLSQTVDPSTGSGQATTINYTLDLNAGLTQVLDDGTTNYTYGLGRIAQSSIVNQQSEIAYFLGDALGSVRQMTDQSGAITYARTYDPGVYPDGSSFAHRVETSVRFNTGKIAD